jgi:hypothetical protein
MKLMPLLDILHDFSLSPSDKMKSVLSVGPADRLSSRGDGYNRSNKHEE